MYKLISNILRHNCQFLTKYLWLPLVDTFRNFNEAKPITINELGQFTCCLGKSLELQGLSDY